MKCTARLSEISPWNVLVAPLLLLRCFLCIPGYFVETEMQYPYAEHERVHMTAPEIGAGVGAPRYIQARHRHATKKVVSLGSFGPPRRASGRRSHAHV